MNNDGVVVLVVQASRQHIRDRQAVRLHHKHCKVMRVQAGRLHHNGSSN